MGRADATIIDDGLITGSINGGVFASVAIPIGGLAVKGRWTPIFSQLASARFRDCAGSDTCSPSEANLGHVLEKARALRFRDKLAVVNRVVNRTITYSRDMAVYGMLDHWATPAETLARGRGDCEDIAILKMAALMKVGIPARSMSLVILRDTRRSVFHAVLSVSTSHGHFILDNMQDAVLADAAIPDYQALYSLSTDRAWIHGYRKSGAVAAVDTPLETVIPGEGPEPDRLSMAHPALGRLSVW
ncbi:MAG: transglutaminase-like cysteine peptidase [Rhizobiaceae bacterium]|nr:transglutaminase-like cysteine peptidase [Rhizobiaceae bacterium]MCV0405600.1 transglutaminase-like cysteine peptidase [Rhizobiaceae bacterium]